MLGTSTSTEAQRRSSAGTDTTKVITSQVEGGCAWTLMARCVVAYSSTLVTTPAFSGRRRPVRVTREQPRAPARPNAGVTDVPGRPWPSQQAMAVVARTGASRMARTAFDRVVSGAELGHRVTSDRGRGTTLGDAVRGLGEHAISETLSDTAAMRAVATSAGASVAPFYRRIGAHEPRTEDHERQESDVTRTGRRAHPRAADS